MPTSVISVGATVPYTTAFSFEDPSLQPYQRRAENRLAFILQQLDLGSPANLGYTKVQWLPDDIVRVRYLAMEGILEPIIVVRVEFQESFNDQRDQERLQELLEELEEEAPEPEPPRNYRPALWVGVACFNHQLGNSLVANVNCDFWGHPIDPHIYAFEPRQAGAGQVDFDFEQSCETMPGRIWGGATWAERVGNNASEQRLYRVNSGQDWELNEFGQNQGTFSDGQWFLEAQGLVQATHTNMIATAHTDTQVTAPVEAYGTGIDKLPEGYWTRSIVLDPSGIEFPSGLEGTEEFKYTAPLGGGVTAAFTTTYSGGTIVGEVVPGYYEVSCWTASFECECTSANVHLRVILGQSGGDQIIADFYPAGIGNGPANNELTGRVRSRVLGGNPPCGFGNDPDEVFGPNTHGPGWWVSSLFIDVENGVIADIDPATQIAPFFGGGCPPDRGAGPDDPACVGCTGSPTEAPANNLDYPFGIHWLTANGVAVDLRGGVLWHMARVMQVDNTSGYVCRIQLLGNDGAAGGSCPVCQAFSYGTNMPALGIDPAIPLGTNLTEACGPEQCQSPYLVGELVTVVGWTNQFISPCGVLPGDWRLIVTKPHGAGQDFTTAYWQQLRCPGFEPVTKYFAGVVQAFANRDGCSGGAISVSCGCNGQLRCS